MSQGWCAKGIEKEKNRRIRRNGNTFKGVIARQTGGTFAEKQVMLRNYKALLHGTSTTKNVIYATPNGLVVGAKITNQGGVRLVGRDGKGLPSEGYDDPKFDVAVVGDVKIVRKRTNPSKGVMVAAVASKTVATWSRKSGFAGK